VTDTPPTLEQLADAWAAQQVVDDHLADLLRRWHARPRVPATGRIFINGREASVPIPVHKFDFAIVYKDDLGTDITAPTTWAVLGLDGSPSTSATIAVDPTSDEKGTGEITADAAPPFKLQAVAGGKTFETDELDPVVGTVSTGTITLTEVP
jgi:hypothetical protein